MTRINIVITAGLVLAVTLPTVSAQAQSPRTFVSAAGSDSNPCSFAAPCRHFQNAVNVTSSGGEVDALDPAGYGPITITQSITIEGQGWSYIAPPANGNGITINAGSGNVSIHGVSVDGAGITGSTNGIVFNSGESLTIEGCFVRNMEGSGLAFKSTATTTQTLAVSNSYFSDNAADGILIEPESSGAITAAIDRSAFSGNRNINLFVYGSDGTGAVNVAVTDSVAANGNSFNGNTGFAVEGNGHVANLSLTHCLAVGNAIGVSAGSTNSTLWLAQSTVAGNATGYEASNGGVIKSYGDNYLLAGNGTNSGTLTTIGKQ
jgi:hypothetical protein